MDEAERERIWERVRHDWTGNRSHDLMQFQLGEEFDTADEEWHRECQRRYERAELRRRAGLKLV